MIFQKEISLQPYRKGFHLITDIVKNNTGDLPEFGILNLFIKHTSAALTINENADPSVRQDLLSISARLVPESTSLYVHDSEGIDDMPAHFHSSIFGSSISIPITNKRLNLGIWQGIYLCEFRNRGGNRKIVITIYS